MASEIQSRFEPACWRWPVSKQMREKIARYSSEAFDPDPAVRTEQQLVLLMQWQRFRCAICGRLVSNRGPNRIAALRTDHDHETNLVRGLLCGGCNTAEGRLNLRAPRYLKYRLRYPTKILGLEIPYTSSWRPRDAAPVDAEVFAAKLRRIKAALAQKPNDPVVVDELLELSTSMVRALRVTPPEEQSA